MERCIACDERVSAIGERQGYVYGLCASCHTIQLTPIPKQAEVERAYAASRYATGEHGQIDADEIRKTSGRYYATLARALIEHGRTGTVVDYGAGWGGLCELLLQLGFHCRGLELAGNMVAECQRRGLPVEQKGLDALLTEGVKAEAVVLCGVFEHLLNPRDFLLNAHAVLSNGGVVISLQPTGIFARLLAWLTRLGNRQKALPSSFWVFDPPWHVAFYSVAGMQRLAQETGFELSEVRFAPQGRMKGAYGAAQSVLEGINRIGWPLFGPSWPLMVSHIFVLRKKSMAVDHAGIQEEDTADWPTS